MERIIAGQFQSNDAAAIAAALIAKYVDLSDICVFHNVPSRAPERRAGGVMVSVRIFGAVDERRVIGTLYAQGAADIEQTQGKWRDGNWTDFDPDAAPRLVRGLVN
jgi:hypothetical protein